MTERYKYIPQSMYEETLEYTRNSFNIERGDNQHEGESEDRPDGNVARPSGAQRGAAEHVMRCGFPPPSALLQTASWKLHRSR